MPRVCEDAPEAERPCILISTVLAAVMLAGVDGRKVTTRHVRRIAAQHHVMACMVDCRHALWRMEDIERIGQERAEHLAA